MKMKTLLCSELKRNMRVILTKPDEDYTIGLGNPVVGSKWECEGTVTEYSYEDASVRWDNGHSNGYKDNELSLADRIEGRCKSIW